MSLESRRRFVYGGVTLYAGPFACPSTTPTISYSLPDRQIRLNGPTTPITQRLPAITRDRFSLFRFRSPLLTESRLLSLPVGNEMFHFPTFPPLALCVQARVTGHDSCRVSPFGNPRITARLTAPRGLSQPPTSFIGSWCQGIHRAPLITWPQRCSRPLCSSQDAGGSVPAHACAAVLREDRPIPATSRPRDEPAVPQRVESIAPDPSGPNSVPRPTGHVPTRRSTPRGGSTSRPSRRPRSN